jgi:hypothetical protein
MSLLYSRIAASRRDADADAYISAIRTAGATVTAAQRDYINDFIRAEKIASRWDSIKRFYLPIWGVAAANAICLRSLTSGTFVGSVTHGAGFVQGDGATGYFDTSSRFDSLGLSVGSGYLFSLIYSGTLASLAQVVGAGVGATNKQTVLGQAATAGRARLRYSGTGTGSVETTSTVTGIISGSRTTGNRSIYRRITASRSTLISTSGGDSGTLPESNVYALASNSNDAVGGSTPAAYSNVQLGCYGFGLGLSDSSDSLFTLALKNLWEGTTGLTLP